MSVKGTSTAYIRVDRRLNNNNEIIIHHRFYTTPRSTYHRIGSRKRYILSVGSTQVLEARLLILAIGPQERAQKPRRGKDTGGKEMPPKAKVAPNTVLTTEMKAHR